MLAEIGAADVRRADLDRSVAEVTAGLSAAGIRVCNPGEDTYFLKVTSTRGTFCEVEITRFGGAVWEYRPFSGRTANAEVVARVVMDIMDCTEPRPDYPPDRRPPLTMKSRAGMALRNCGLDVCLSEAHADDFFFEVWAEIEVTSPDRPERGIVMVDDDGSIRWECRFAIPGAVRPAIEPAEFAATMARVIAGNEPGSHRPKRRPSDCSCSA